MATWSRRLSAAQSRPNLGRAEAGRRRVELPDTLPEGIAATDAEAIAALLAVAAERRGFETTISVRVDGDELDVLVAYTTQGPVAIPADAVPPGDDDEPSDDEAEADADGDFVDEMSGERVIEMLTDTLVVTSDIVAIFASVGAEAIWANDAFATAIPIRESDKIWLVELLDEWSKGHFEVNVLPALVQYGRWHGRLTLQPDPGVDLPISASIVAHRDDTGEIEAVSLVARDLRRLNEAEDRARSSETRLAALVENAADIIVVVDSDTDILYASPAATRLLGLEDGALEGVRILDRIHPDDLAKADFRQMAQPDQDGLSPTVEIRLQHTDGTWRHFEMVATDLTDNPVIGGVVLNARDITDRVEAVARLADRAYTDPLTLLPNRMRLIDRLEQLLHAPREHEVLLALFDLDRFKACNESFGHAVGDELLRQVAHRLTDLYPEAELVARLGGNEFAVVLTEVSDVDAAVSAADRARVVLANPYTVGTNTAELTASCGLAVSTASHTPAELITDADTAVGVAKGEGGDRARFLTDALRSSAQARARTEQLLRRALDADEGVQVHYQPIFDIRSRRVASAEALLRVHDGDGELLSPAAFLDAAESTGLILPLSTEVIRETCRQLAEWNVQIDPNTPREISVNVSPKQLGDPGFVDVVTESLEAAGVSPERLCLEITESLFIGQSDDVDRTVEAVRALGVRIGLDDFGAGQSSLGYLRRFPLDFVKIDRGLIAGVGVDQEDTAIVRATIELGHSLGLLVVAVGVETAEQLEFLDLLGCDRAQGFHFSPAVPALEFADRVSAAEAS